MKFTSHPYQVEDDDWRMREFLRQVFMRDNRRIRTWHVWRLSHRKVCTSWVPGRQK